MVTIENINRASGNDIGATLTVRYRLESDPDIDASYTAVTTTKTIVGITVPVFNADELPDGIYILHTYQTASGTATGTKVRVVVDTGVSV